MFGVGTRSMLGSQILDPRFYPSSPRRDPRDPRSRSKLYVWCIRLPSQLIAAFKSPFFPLLKYVTSLVYHDDGDYYKTEMMSHLLRDALTNDNTI